MRNNAVQDIVGNSTDLSNITIEPFQVIGNKGLSRFFRLICFRPVNIDNCCMQLLNEEFSPIFQFYYITIYLPLPAIRRVSVTRSVGALDKFPQKMEIAAHYPGISQRNYHGSDVGSQCMSRFFYLEVVVKEVVRSSRRTVSKSMCELPSAGEIGQMRIGDT